MPLDQSVALIGGHRTNWFDRHVRTFDVSPRITHLYALFNDRNGISYAYVIVLVGFELSARTIENELILLFFENFLKGISEGLFLQEEKGDVSLTSNCSSSNICGMTISLPGMGK